MSNYKLSTLSEITCSATEAKKTANLEPNQNGYNAAWLHGYADALREVAQQMSACTVLEIKVIVNGGVTDEVLKSLDIPVHVEVIGIDKEYEDYEQLCDYRDALYKTDSGYQKCDYTVAHFEADGEVEM